MTLSGAGDRVIEKVSRRKWLAQLTRSETMIWYSRVPTCVGTSEKNGSFSALAQAKFSPSDRPSSQVQHGR